MRRGSFIPTIVAERRGTPSFLPPVELFQPRDLASHDPLLLLRVGIGEFKREGRAARAVHILDQLPGRKPIPGPRGAALGGGQPWPREMVPKRGFGTSPSAGLLLCRSS